MHPLCKLWIALWLLIYMLEAITPHNGSISTRLPWQFMLLLVLWAYSIQAKSII